MKHQLFENEQLISENTLNHEAFTITNKRLLYASPNANGFVGIAELRGSNVAEIDVTYDKFNLPEALPLVMICYLLSFIVVASYEGATGEGMVGMLMSGLAYGFIGGIAIPIILNIIQGIMRYTVKQVQLTIQKTDNTYFLQHLYAPEQFKEVSAIAEKINAAKYN